MLMYWMYTPLRREFPPPCRVFARAVLTQPGKWGFHFNVNLVSSAVVTYSKLVYCYLLNYGEAAVWSKSYSKKIEGLAASQVWRVWTDINQWHTWQDDIEYAKLDGEFKQAACSTLNPKVAQA